MAKMELAGNQFAQAALALVGQLEAQGLVSSPVPSPERKVARVELSPAAVSRQLLVLHVPEGHVPPLPRRESVVTPVVVDQSQPQPQNSDNLVEQMRLMMQGMLSGTEARLSSSMKASVDSLRSDLVTERAERVASLDQINALLDAHDTRMAALEAVPQSSG